MVSGFFDVGSQVVEIFIFILIGVVLTKFKILNQSGADAITNLVIYIVSPCMIINAFSRDYEPQMMKSLLITLGCSFGILLFSVIIAELIFIKKKSDRAVVLKFAMVFSNCGFMAMPLQMQLIGDEGVFYGAIFVAVFNFFVWSYGIILMSGERKPKMMIKALLNPGIIGTLIGLMLFVLPIKVPVIISSCISSLAVMNTPLPMIVIGFFLASSNLKKALFSPVAYLAMSLRLIILPMLALGAMYLLKIDNIIILALVVAVAAPCASYTTMFSLKYKRDTEFSAEVVALSSLFSLITIPIIVSLTKYILN